MFVFIIIFCLSNQIYAKYNYKIVLDAFYLNRDNSEIIYQIEKSVPDGEYTNKDVILRIVSNKEIEEVEGFELDESRTTLTKTVSENEEKNVVLEDLSGNKKQVSYVVSNIDKEPPRIIGIEDGQTYNQKLALEYEDNVGIKDIKIDKYDTNLQISCLEDYYDIGNYKKIDVLGNQIHIDVTKHPKGTRAYKFYLNNVLKATTEQAQYTFKGLTNATTYTIKVEAVNENDEVIDSVSKSIKTKCFTGLTAQRNGDNFTVKITGIDSRVNVGFCALWHQNTSNQKITYPSINSDRSITLSFNAYEVDGTKCSGYYYFHLQLYNYSNTNLNEIICMNIKFNNSSSSTTTEEIIDSSVLDKSGNYEITVTDLAGNQTTKCCTIKL